MKFRDKLIRIASNVEDHYDSLFLKLKTRLGMTGPLQIVSYRTYGTSKQLYVKGRVIEKKNIRKGSLNDSRWNNILNMYRRFETDEVPGATVRITFCGEEFRAVTDNEGYFVLRGEPRSGLISEDMWFEVDIELVDAPVPFEPGLKVTAEVLVPPADAEYGIISDIDDTIVRTDATSLLAMSRNTFFHNAYTRLPFAGVAEFYKALLLGRNGKRNNPFFYVSSSPWNLYELLRDFMDLNKIPEGPLLLRDFGLEPRQLGTVRGHMGHKFKEIESILQTYPELKFILIGDSGQEDPVIYREVVRKFPDRVLAIYIRDVQLAERERIAIEVSRELAGFRVDMMVVDNTVEAADHAAKARLIFTEAIPEIVEDKKQDKGEIAGKLES